MCIRDRYGAIKSEFERVLNMNKEWSELNKTMQAQIKKKDTYKRGIDTLLTLRSQLIQTLVSFKEELCREDFNSIPFINADGYHSKTIASVSYTHLDVYKRQVYEPTVRLPLCGSKIRRP